MSTRIQPGAIALAGAVLGFAASLAGAAQAQLRPGSQQGLGLTGASIPPILQKIRNDPYGMPAEPVCASVAKELTEIDSVMGPDVDSKQKTHQSMTDRAVGYARDMIPYHGVVRFLTRADSKDHDLQLAANAGYARRGFLHGLQAQHHCDGPAETKIALVEAAPSVAARAVDANAEVETPRKLLIDAPVPTAPPTAGDELSTRMLRGPTPAEPPPESAPRTRVVYQLVDSTSGRPIVPDAPPSDPTEPAAGR